MIKMFIFLLKYKILKNETNLSYHPKEFYQLPKNTQRKVLDKYFNQLGPTFQIDAYFNTKESRYYSSGQEVSFYNCYYFDKKVLELNIKNLNLMDKFKIEENKKEYLIDYSIQKIKEENINLNIKDLLIYPDKLPLALSQSIDFMSYLVELDFSNIKYLTYQEKIMDKQRTLIQLALVKARKQPFSLDNFLKNDKTLPKELKTNFDFILYLIENDIQYVDYLTSSILNNITITSKDILVKTIMKSLEKNPKYLKDVLNHFDLSEELKENLEFIQYILSEDIKNITYINWYHLSPKTRNNIIDFLVKKLEQDQLKINILDYPFYHLFLENQSFMNYLINQDFRWISATRIIEKQENDKLIEKCLKKIKETSYKFKLEDFLEDGVYLNYHLLENKKMVAYLFSNKAPIIKHIDFFHLDNPKNVVENILFSIEKKSYEFHNEEFLIEDKYPIPLSCSYRFMKYVIDKNFNNLSYINTTLLDKRELKRIINYAFRMVYYIRGENKKLNFDLEGYFKNSDIIQNDYFQECLKSL